MVESPVRRLAETQLMGKVDPCRVRAGVMSSRENLPIMKVGINLVS